MLFIAFNPYNLILGIVWTIFRIGEGLIQFYNEPNYWKLINIARQYSSTSGAEKTSLSDLARTIFKTKDTRFKFAMICWSIGTLGWLGIVASILVGFSTGVKLVKLNFKDFTAIGGLTAILFEVIIGGWLLFYPLV